MDVIKAVRPKTLSDLLAYEVDPIYTRENLTLLAGNGSARDVDQFSVLGAIAGGTATAAAKSGGNTGQGVLTVDATTPVLSGARDGVYRVVCTTVAAGGGTFTVYDPDGVLLGEIAVGQTFANQIKFAIADGTPDFTAGDAFNITVLTAPKYVALDPTATNGAQNAAGVALFAGHAADGVDGVITGLVRGPALLRSSGIAWPAGISDAQKAIALAQLAALGIVVRQDG